MVPVFSKFGHNLVGHSFWNFGTVTIQMYTSDYSCSSSWTSGLVFLAGKVLLGMFGQIRLRLKAFGTGGTLDS